MAQAGLRAGGGDLTAECLDSERGRYRGTAGESAVATVRGLQPAFRDDTTGEVLPARFANGRLAPLHTLDGLPVAWIARRDEQGRAEAARPGVVCGFLGGGRFYTRAEAAACFGLRASDSAGTCETGY